MRGGTGLGVVGKVGCGVRLGGCGGDGVWCGAGEW